MNAILKLINALTGVITVHIGVLCTEMAPLQMTTTHNQITVGCIKIACITVPESHTPDLNRPLHDLSDLVSPEIVSTRCHPKCGFSSLVVLWHS